MKTLTTLVMSLALLSAKVAAADTSAASTALMDPSKATASAPPMYKVKVATTKGDFTIEVHRDWAPNGADRFYNLVKAGFFNDLAFFRVVKGFMVQFGIHGDPAVNRVWRRATIKDDPSAKKSNTRGTITFATSGPDMRTTQVFSDYRRFVTDWQASGPPKAGAGATPGRASQRPSKGKAARQAG